MPIKQVKEYILPLFLLFTIILAVFHLLYICRYGSVFSAKVFG